MEITIREATLSDAESIAYLNRTAMGYDYPIAETENKLQAVLSSDRDRIFVVIADRKIVGYIHANDYDALYFPSLKDVMGIAVDNAYRRHGIGKMLLTAVETWAKETGAKGIRLVSSSERTEAHAFYRNCGFEGGKSQRNFKKLF